MRAIVQRLTRAHSPLEPVQVLLACGHKTESTQTTTRARCPDCKSTDRIRQAQARINRGRTRRKLEAGTGVIFSAVEKGRVSSKPNERAGGYRVLRVEVWDVTPDARTTKGLRGPEVKTALAMERVRIACDAAGLDYVRAQLLEFAARLDGVVLIT